MNEWLWGAILHGGGNPSKIPFEQNSPTTIDLVFKFLVL